MEIAEHIFHFNDRWALENQSSATSGAIYKHFWDSFLDNPLAQEFLPKAVLQVRDSYHLVSFHPTYGAAILYKDLDSLEVFVRTVGLDKWEGKIHASSHSRECYAAPSLEVPKLMDQGPFPTHLVNDLEKALVEALRKSERMRGPNRRNTPNHEGNQKTPSFLNEKLCQSIEKVISAPTKEVQGNVLQHMFAYGGTTDVAMHTGGTKRKTSAYGGTTDVGMHTGGKKRNTAAPLVFSVISTMLHLECRPESEFRTLMAIYLASFLDELPAVTSYDARAMDRYIIVMRETKPFIEKLENEILVQKLLQRMRTWHDQIYSVPYGPTQALNRCDIAEILNDLSAPEFPKKPLLPQINESESFLEMSRREANKNLMWIDMNSKAFSGSVQEAWVQLHALNTRFWKAASTMNEDSTQERVELLKQDLERLSRIVKVAFASANEGRYTMSVVVQSYELLAAVICFCFAHREMEQNHTWFKEYIPAFDPNNLDHLVLDDKSAIDAAIEVRKFLEMRADGIGVPLRKHEDTMRLAKHFASEQSEGAKRNRQLHKDFLVSSRQKIVERWEDISERQDELSELDNKMRRAEGNLSSTRETLRVIKCSYKYHLDPRYHTELENVGEAEAEVSRLRGKIKSLEWKPDNLTFSLPEESDAASLLFFAIMEEDVRHLADLAHRSECLLKEKLLWLRRRAKHCSLGLAKAVVCRKIKFVKV